MEEFRIIAKELVELFTTASLQGIFPTEIKTKKSLMNFLDLKMTKWNISQLQDEHIDCWPKNLFLGQFNGCIKRSGQS